MKKRISHPKATRQLRKTTSAKPTRSAKDTQAPATVPAANAGEDAWRERRKQRKAEQEALIATDPRNAMNVAQDHMDYAVEVFSALINKGALFFPLESVDGKDFSSDHAAQCLCSRFSSLTQQVAKYARLGHRDFIAATWWAARLFTEVVHDLAFDKATAQELEWYARRSLFLPSLRARPGSFTYDFQTVASTLHLSEDCLCHMTDSAAHKLDSPVTSLIADVVEFIGWTQEHTRFGREFYANARKRHANRRSRARLPKPDADYARRIEAMTEDEYLVTIHHCRPETLHYDRLPPLTKATADEWWTKAVRQEVTKRFPSLAGTRLHALLKGNKPHEKLDDLRRRGKHALRSLARPTPQNPHPS